MKEERYCQDEITWAEGEDNGDLSWISSSPVPVAWPPTTSWTSLACSPADDATKIKYEKVGDTNLFWPGDWKWGDYLPVENLGRLQLADQQFVSMTLLPMDG